MGDSLQTKFLMILGWKYCLNAVDVFSRNNVKTIVFAWFLFSDLFTNLVTSGVVLGVILNGLGYLGSTFSDF